MGRESGRTLVLVVLSYVPSYQRRLSVAFKLMKYLLLVETPSFNIFPLHFFGGKTLRTALLSNNRRLVLGGVLLLIMRRYRATGNTCRRVALNSRGKKGLSVKSTVSGSGT